MELYTRREGARGGWRARARAPATSATYLDPHQPITRKLEGKTRHPLIVARAALCRDRRHRVVASQVNLKPLADAVEPSAPGTLAGRLLVCKHPPKPRVKERVWRTMNRAGAHMLVRDRPRPDAQRTRDLQVKKARCENGQRLAGLALRACDRGAPKKKTHPAADTCAERVRDRQRRQVRGNDALLAIYCRGGNDARAGGQKCPGRHLTARGDGAPRKQKGQRAGDDCRGNKSRVRQFSRQGGPMGFRIGRAPEVKWLPLLQS